MRHRKNEMEDWDGHNLNWWQEIFWFCIKWFI